MSRDLHFEFTYPHAPERVWRAITDSAAIARWLMPNDFEPVVGREFHFRTTPRGGWDGTVKCKVLEVSPPRTLAYSWVGGGIDTVVTIRLVPEAGGTKLTLDHAGFAGFRGFMASKFMGSGWKSRILGKRLPAVLNYVDDTGFHPPADGIIPGCESEKEAGMEARR
jgi:uncharacterized protein YndB with AHSA1/START domain